MILKISVLLLAACVSGEYTCYWNRHCDYQLYSSKTSYDSVRGDIRDHARPENCEVVSMWALHRHGNRNPGSSTTAAMKTMAGLRDQIVASYEAGTSQLCAQDIEEFRRWSWNETIEVSESFLTGVGYEELYAIGKRVGEKYPELLTGDADEYNFRPTKEQRTIVSAVAYVNGLVNGTNLTLAIDAARDQDNVLRPYENCDMYQSEVKNGPAVENAVNEFSSTSEYVAIQAAVQKRLGISYELASEDIYSLYELCRFYRSWSPKQQSPWCSVFTDEDLIVLEYRDDVRHYYRNGYGSSVNVNLGESPLKDLYDNFVAATQGQGKKIVAYFTHDTMMEMVYSALGLYKDDTPLLGTVREDGRKWRSSYFSAMASNLMAVLNRCQDNGVDTFRVQIFNNEKVTGLCPQTGCPWGDFQSKFQGFSDDLDFCKLDNSTSESLENNNSAFFRGSWVLISTSVLIVLCRIW